MCQHPIIPRFSGKTLKGNEVMDSGMRDSEKEEHECIDVIRESCSLPRMYCPFLRRK